MYLANSVFHQLGTVLPFLTLQHVIQDGLHQQLDPAGKANHSSCLAKKASNRSSFLRLLRLCCASLKRLLIVALPASVSVSSTRTCETQEHMMRWFRGSCPDQLHRRFVGYGSANGKLPGLPNADESIRYAASIFYDLQDCCALVLRQSLQPAGVLYSASLSAH